MSNVRVNGLFDTGSSVLLAKGKLKQDLISSTTKCASPPPVKLCGAGGEELCTLGCYEIPLKVENPRMTHKILFIDNLQIGCNLGMDFISQHNVIIDAAKRSL